MEKLETTFETTITVDVPTGSGDMLEASVDLPEIQEERMRIAIQALIEQMDKRNVISLQPSKEIPDPAKFIANCFMTTIKHNLIDGVLTDNKISVAPKKTITKELRELKEKHGYAV